MNNLSKKLLSIFILLALSNCGIAHNFYTIGYDLTAIGPHPYRVTKEIENSPNKKGLGIVNLGFQVDEKDSKEYNGTNTIWRKINDDGTVGEKITLTYLQMGKRGRVRVALEPGTYFMDGIRYFSDIKGSNRQTQVNLGAFTELWSSKQKGWDFVKKQPRWFKFTVKAGQELQIPEVFVSGYCKSGSSSCNGEDFVIKMIPKDNTNKKSNDYNFGSEAVVE